MVDFGWSGWQVEKWSQAFKTYSKLSLPHYYPPYKISSKFDKKTQKLEIFTFGRFWLVGLVGQKMVVGISNSFFVVFSPLLTLIPNFIQIRQKTQKLEIFTFGRFWLVGLVGQSHFKHSISVRKVINDLCTKFELNRMKNGQISPFLNFWLVGWLGRSAWAKLKTKL